MNSRMTFPSIKLISTEIARCVRTASSVRISAATSALPMELATMKPIRNGVPPSGPSFVSCHPITATVKSYEKINPDEIDNRAWLLTGVDKMRRSISGKPLPSPRKVSSLVHRPLDIVGTKFTTMLMQWGQFLDHDLTCNIQDSLSPCSPANSNAFSFSSWESSFIQHPRSHAASTEAFLNAAYQTAEAN